MIFSVHSSALKGYRFPRSVIGYAAWAYHRFALSLRDVEDLLAERGISVSHETIRDWVAKFGTQIAAKILRDRAKPADKWHLDEVVITISGTKHWLWRAVDGNGDTLEILVQSRRNARAAKRFLRKLMKRWGAPRVIVTDKLRSFRVATRELCPGIDHRSHKGLNNRSEASHRLPVDGRRYSAGSNQQDRPRCSCPSMIKLPFSFARNVTVYQPLTTAANEQRFRASGLVAWAK